jgi:hypothetical protein
MSRSLVLFSLLLLGAMLISGGPLPAGNADEPKDQAVSVAQKMFKPIKFNGFDDPKTTLQEALDSLSNAYDVNFDVIEEVFNNEGLKDILAFPIAEKPIPKMNNVRLDRVLRKILSRIPVSATYLVRRDGIEITTVTAQKDEVWGPNYQGQPLPLVHVNFDQTPLDEALKELADQAGMNVMLDARVAGKAKTLVTSRLVNAPLDTAVRMLADMADLKPYQVDNLLYVTTKENATKLEAKDHERLSTEDPAGGGGPRIGSGPGRLRPLPAAAM